MIYMKFAKYTFYGAGISGLVLLLPQYFLESKVNTDYPPAITHPEYFYGFIGVAAAFQIVFLIIGRNPGKYRALMIPSIVEKLSFALAAIILLSLGRAPEALLPFGLMDGILAILFILSYVYTSKPEPE